MLMLFDNVLIKEVKEESAVVDIGKDRKDRGRGEVIAVGPGQAYGMPAFSPTVVRKGDIVDFLKGGGISHEVEDDGVKYFIVRERDLLRILNREG